MLRGSETPRTVPGMTHSLIGVLNAHMFGTPAEAGEHVDWSAPDVFTADEFADLLGDPAEYAAASPHMIVFVAS